MTHASLARCAYERNTTGRMIGSALFMGMNLPGARGLHIPQTEETGVGLSEDNAIGDEVFGAKA